MQFPNIHHSDSECCAHIVWDGFCCVCMSAHARGRGGIYILRVHIFMGDLYQNIVMQLTDITY